MQSYEIETSFHNIPGNNKLKGIFIIAGDENKKQLLDLGAGEALLKLMQSEDRIVRRNACMAMGVMTANRMFIKINV